MECVICGQDTYNPAAERCSNRECIMGKHVTIIGDNRRPSYGQIVGQVATDGIPESFLVRFGGSDTVFFIEPWKVSAHSAVKALYNNSQMFSAKVPEGSSGTKKVWECYRLSCKHKNEEKDRTCKRCNAPKIPPALPSLPIAQKWRGRNFQCRNVGCKGINSEMNAFCWRCGEPRPVQLNSIFLPAGHSRHVSYWIERQIALCRFVCTKRPSSWRSASPWTEKDTRLLSGVIDHFLQCVGNDLTQKLARDFPLCEQVQQALVSSLLTNINPGKPRNRGPLLVWRFFDGSDVGLMSELELDRHFGKHKCYREVMRFGEKPLEVGNGARCRRLFRLDDREKYKRSEGSGFPGGASSSDIPLSRMPGASSGGRPPQLSSRSSSPSRRRGAASGNIVLRRVLRPSGLSPHASSGQTAASSSTQALHQQGIKTDGSHKSDLVSATCSLPNLVHCSAGDFPCVPGGQVVPMIFGDHAYLRAAVAETSGDKTYAPFLGLFLVNEDEYIIDWSESPVDNENNDKLVSFFEREVVFNSRGGTRGLRMSSHLVLMYANPFWKSVTLATK